MHLLLPPGPSMRDSTPQWGKLCSGALKHGQGIHIGMFSPCSDSASLKPSHRAYYLTFFALVCDDLTWVLFLFDGDSLDLATRHPGPSALQSDDSTTAPILNGTPTHFGPGLPRYTMKVCYIPILKVCYIPCGLFLLVGFCCLLVASPYLTLSLALLHSWPFTSELCCHETTGSVCDPTLIQPDNSSFKLVFSCSRVSSICSYFWTQILLDRSSYSRFATTTLASILATKRCSVGSAASPSTPFFSFTSPWLSYPPESPCVFYGWVPRA